MAFATAIFRALENNASRERRRRLRRTAAPVKNYCCRDCNCTGARACALACFCGGVDTGLRAGLATDRAGLADAAADVAADVLGRRFCSEALEIARAICSWLALSCSAIPAFSRAN